MNETQTKLPGPCLKFLHNLCDVGGIGFCLVILRSVLGVQRVGIATLLSEPGGVRSGLSDVIRRWTILLIHPPIKRWSAQLAAARMCLAIVRGDLFWPRPGIRIST